MCLCIYECVFTHEQMHGMQSFTRVYICKYTHAHISTCPCAHTGTHAYTYIDARAHTHTDTYTRAHISALMHAHAHIYTPTHMHACIRAYTCISIHIHTCIPTHMPTYIYIHTYMHTHTYYLNALFPNAPFQKQDIVTCVLFGACAQRDRYIRMTYTDTDVESVVSANTYIYIYIYRAGHPSTNLGWDFETKIVVSHQRSISTNSLFGGYDTT